ncbi:TonB-dependent receptor [Cellvibrio mixtus]|uniref:TonB-dependent receptor n=1 Tax=Cellvibrio mixtus TaxID=39650 RepID=UPI00069468EB|nr:TonB-dependent receptor [Cellvibrio mixtus]
MQNPMTFKKKIIATTVASVMAAGLSSIAFAQDDSAVDEVIVTGIKGSLQRAMDIKRDATGVVDAISAEDIGKMPDSNLAESLQRIPGVSIDRVNGEGSKVTVRGLGSGYNLVTLNSRQMPASSFGTSRSFDFANLASEGIAGVEVFKSGRADVQSGGMGALINIQTPRPLNSPGLKAVVSAKAVSDRSSVVEEGITPEISGLFSNTFADDKIGVSLTGSYQDRNSGNRQSQVSGWFTHAADKPIGDWDDLPSGYKDVPVNRSRSLPSEIMYRVNEVNRKRTNAQLTVQYQPVDRLTVTADYLYVNQEREENNFGTGLWFTRPNDGSMEIEWSDTNPAYPLSYTEVARAKELNYVINHNQAKSDLKSAGVNVKWDATDNLVVEFDAHNSDSYSGPNGKWGGNNQFHFGIIDDYKVNVDFTKKYPLMHFEYADGRDDVVPDVSRMQLTNNIFRVQDQDSAVDEYQLKGTYTFDDSFIDNIKAGAGTNEITNKYYFLGLQEQNQGTWGGVQGKNGIGDIPQYYWIVDRLTNYFDNSDFNSPYFQNTIVRANWDELLDVSARLYGSDTGPCPKAYCTTRDNTKANDGLDDDLTIETTDFAYVQFGFKPEIAGMPANLAVGVRYETTDVESSQYVAAYLPLARWNGGNEYALTANGNEYGTSKGSYSKTLPNLDFDISLTDDIKARASVSKTIARADFADLRGGYKWNAAPRSSEITASSGNPSLLPMESTNFDISAEWYYADSSYVSLGYFKKDVADFIGGSAPQEGSTADLPGGISEPFRTPYMGERWKAAVAAGNTTNPDIAAYIRANYPETVDPVTGHIWALPTDPILNYESTQPINNKDASIDGIEIAWQHTFGESGFGFQANATVVDSDTEFDNASTGSQFAVYGLSDSANFIGFYDKNGLQARLAYNWRDDFLNSYAGYTEAYGQLDASVSYDITDNLTVSMEALNLTDEDTRTYVRDTGMTSSYTETGARYNVGVRYSF